MKELEAVDGQTVVAKVKFSNISTTKPTITETVCITLLTEVIETQVLQLYHYKYVWYLPRLNKNAMIIKAFATIIVDNSHYQNVIIQQPVVT